jgi:hypothetical protein
MSLIFQAATLWLVVAMLSGCLPTETTASHKVDLASACKRFVGELMGRDPEIMKAVDNGTQVVSVSYARPADGKLWKYECKVDGEMIIWRGVDVFGPGQGPGRWRVEDAKPLVSFK